MATKPNENNGNGQVIGTAHAQGPQGTRLALNITPAFLNPEAGARISEAPRGSSEYCGRLWGAVDYGYEHPNHLNKDVNSIRWHGKFGFQKADGTIGGGATMYVPSVIERQLHGLGTLIHRDPEPPPPRSYHANAEFSIEVWCERVIPKPGRPPIPFAYVVYDLREDDRDISHLAPPEVRPLLPAPPVERRLIAYIDAETGEEVAGPRPLVHHVDAEAATQAPPVHPESEADMRAAAARLDAAE